MQRKGKQQSSDPFNNEFNKVPAPLRIGKLTVLINKMIAEGGFARVYEAHTETTNTRVAVKRIITPPDSEHIHLVEQEITLMSKMKHKNIVEFIETSKTPISTGGNEYLIVMEFCSGGQLVDLMNRRVKIRFKEPEILSMFSEVCEAVSYLHYMTPPVIHRDIKVENVLISADRVFKLCDFGSCTTEKFPPGYQFKQGELERVQEEIEKFTTIQYRAPEMCDLYRRQGLNEKTDIWALGVLLYKLCYYTTPFDNSKMAILNAQVTFPDTPSYSDEIKSFIKLMLAANPLARPNIYRVTEAAFNMRGMKYSHSNPYQDDKPQSDAPLPKSESVYSLSTSTSMNFSLRSTKLSEEIPPQPVPKNNVKNSTEDAQLQQPQKKVEISNDKNPIPVAEKVAPVPKPEINAPTERRGRKGSAGAVPLVPLNMFQQQPNSNGIELFTLSSISNTLSDKQQQQPTSNGIGLFASSISTSPTNQQQKLDSNGIGLFASSISNTLSEKQQHQPNSNGSASPSINNTSPDKQQQKPNSNGKGIFTSPSFNRTFSGMKDVFKDNQFVDPFDRKNSHYNSPPDDKIGSYLVTSQSGNLFVLADFPMDIDDDLPKKQSNASSLSDSRHIPVTVPAPFEPLSTDLFNIQETPSDLFASGPKVITKSSSRIIDLSGSNTAPTSNHNGLSVPSSPGNQKSSFESTQKSSPVDKNFDGIFSTALQSIPSSGEVSSSTTRIQSSPSTSFVPFKQETNESISRSPSNTLVSLKNSSLVKSESKKSLSAVSATSSNSKSQEPSQKQKQQL